MCHDENRLTIVYNSCQVMFDVKKKALRSRLSLAGFVRPLGSIVGFGHPGESHVCFVTSGEQTDVFLTLKDLEVTAKGVGRGRPTADGR
jgi:hypothetical protein